jgi:hypothetical protein
MSILQSITGKQGSISGSWYCNQERLSVEKMVHTQKAVESRQFELNHLPAIARKYVHVWELELLVDDDVIAAILAPQDRQSDSK